METDSLNQILALVLKFYQSSFFLGIKFLLAVYAAVLFVDITLLLILRGLGSNIRTALKGMDIPTIPKGKLRKKWDKIKIRLESENPSQYKVAIIEADKVVDGILGGIGYKGKDMLEKLEKVKPDHIENLDNLHRAHQIRNQIIHEKDFNVSRKLAGEIIKIYEDFLRSLEFI